MKKWAVVNLETNKINAVYSSEEADYRRFGGDNGNPKRTLHIEVPEEVDISDLSTLEAYDTEKEIGTTFQTVKDQVNKDIYFKVYDEDGQPLLDDEGIQVMDVKYEEVPTMEAIKSIRVK